jgi:hypothetical protein
MRKYLLVVWLLLPVLAGAYHFGPGQDQKQFDKVDGLVAEAKHFVDELAWEVAQEKYEAALELLPAKDITSRRKLQLEIAKLQMLNRQLPEAHDLLTAMKDELEADSLADPQLLAEVQSTYANAKFYMTWLMRLEGNTDEVWKPEIETARQVYRQLAEAAREAGDKQAEKRHTEDLEASIRLARLDLSELQGLPLPSQ